MTSSPEDSQRYWDHLARLDPLWAILSEPAKFGRRWDLGEFMKTGEREIALLLFHLRELGITPATNLALDFGCGIGRLTQALARRFESTVGVDISPTMIALATRLNRYGDRATYLCNRGTEIAGVASGSATFIYSNITLQHVPPADAKSYLREFMRLLDRDGVLVFQLPSHRVSRSELTTRVMPASAYRASVRWLANPPSAMGRGSTHSLRVEVTNTSSGDWVQPEVGSIRLGNHWFDARAEQMVLQDDGRSVLPQRFESGQRYTADLQITAPSSVGMHIVELDLVHEGVCWFADKGSPALRWSVTVSDSDAGAAVPTMTEFAIPDYDGVPYATPIEAHASDVGEFPMNGVHHAEVAALLTSCGGEVLHLIDDPRAGEEWQSFRYVVRKA